MKNLLIAATLIVGTLAIAQECIIPRPATPPKAKLIEVTFTNPDGEARPCFGAATYSGGQPPKSYQMSNADCDRLKRLGDWAVQQDNGWGDGGLP